MTSTIRHMLLASLCFTLAPLCHADLKAGMDAYYAKDYAKAETELRPLAELGDPDANYFLGEVYRVGYDNKGDYLAYKYLARASRARIEAAATDLLVMRNKGWVSLMWQGYQMRPEELAVLAPLKAAADDPAKAGQTDPTTLARLATAYCDQWNVPADGKGGPQGTYPEVLTYLNTAAQAGQPQAEFNLGMSYLLPGYCYSPVKSDPGMALAWLRKAGDHGVLQAQVIIGTLAVYPQGSLAVDAKEGLERLMQAAKAGSPGAYLVLGQYHARATGAGAVAGPDYAEAARWYRKATEVNEPGAFAMLGFMTEEGKGVPQSQEEAVKLYRRGAELGDVPAEKRLSLAYLDGRGVEKDAGAAAQWVKVAASSDDAAAKFQHALNLFAGNGVAADQKRGLEWMRDSANQGFTFAQLYLGDSYAQGRGVAKDPGRAYGLYLLARKYGQPRQRQDAQDHIETLKPTLSPEQIAYGEKLAQVWTSNYAYPGSMHWRALSRKRGDEFDF